jgi:SAM-dependent methyltransferase
MNCKICGGNSLVEVDLNFDFDFLLRTELERIHQILLCESCGTGITQPEMSVSELNKYYPSSYGAVLSRRNVFRVLQFFKYLLDLRRMNGFLEKSQSNYLDLGAGQGEFVKFLRSRGLIADGIEISESERTISKLRNGIELFEGSAENIDVNRKYDCVTLRHVLEHVDDPTLTIDLIRDKVLLEGGLVAIFVPNFQSLERKIFGVYWHGFDIPRHRFHFTLEGLTTLLEARGFNVVFAKRESNGLDFLRSAQNISLRKFDNRFISRLLANKVISLIILGPTILATSLIAAPRLVIFAKAQEAK